MPCRARWLLAMMLAIPGTAGAQSFTPPAACTHGVTGSEGDDPVVLVVDNDARSWLINVPLTLVSSNTPIQWGITISPFRGGGFGYNIFTSYTPFLTSDAFISYPSNLPKYEFILPQPGVSAGRQTAVYDVFQVTIVDSRRSPIPFAMVDFIPDYAGSSPLTIQADGNGVVTLFCVQQNFQGYNITVNDANGKYLYDGSIPGTKSFRRGAKRRAIPLVSRPHPATSR